MKQLTKIMQGAQQTLSMEVELDRLSQPFQITLTYSPNDLCLTVAGPTTVESCDLPRNIIRRYMFKNEHPRLRYIGQSHYTYYPKMNIAKEMYDVSVNTNTNCDISFELLTEKQNREVLDFFTVLSSPVGSSCFRRSEV
jgi:hypothetical protein